MDKKTDKKYHFLYTKQASFVQKPILKQFEMKSKSMNSVGSGFSEKSLNSFDSKFRYSLQTIKIRKIKKLMNSGKNGF